MLAKKLVCPPLYSFLLCSKPSVSSDWIGSFCSRQEKSLCFHVLEYRRYGILERKYDTKGLKTVILWIFRSHHFQNIQYTCAFIHSDFGFVVARTDEFNVDGFSEIQTPKLDA
jgi:hypothetical protein